MYLSTNETPEVENPITSQWITILSLIGIVIIGTVCMYFGRIVFEKYCLRRLKRIVAPIELD